MKKLLLLLTLLFVGYANITCAAATEINQAPQPAALANQPQEIDWDFVIATLKKNNYTPVQIKFAIDLLKDEAKRRGEWYTKVLEKEEAVVAQANSQLLINYSFKWKMIALGSLFVAFVAMEGLLIRFRQIKSLPKEIEKINNTLLSTKYLVNEPDETCAFVDELLRQKNNSAEIES